MKLRKYEIAVLAAASACVLFTAGFFMGRQSAGVHVTVTAGEQMNGANDGQTQADTSDETEPQPAQTPLDLNTASAQQLETLPGIGPELAARIVEDRETNGPFASPEDIQRVAGIGAGKYEKICGLIAADGQAGGE